MTRVPVTRSLVSGRSLLPTNYIIDPGTLFEDFETLGDWTKGASGTIALNQTYVRTGSNSLALTAGSGTNCFATKTISRNMANDRGTSFWVYLPSLTGLSSITIYLSSTTDFTKYFSRATQATALHEGWNCIQVERAIWNNVGSESWSNTMIRLRVRVDAAVGGTPTVYYDSLQLNEYAKPKILVTFDDGWESAYTEGFLYMQTLGLKGTQYVIRDRVGQTGWSPLWQLQEMYDAGWDLGTHGTVRLDSLPSQAAIEAEVAYNRQFLIDNNFTRRDCHQHYAYPQGGYNSNAIAALGAQGFLTGRSIIDRPQANYIDNRYLLTRWGVYHTTTLATAKSYVDKAIAQGSSVWLNFHILSAVATIDTEWGISDFRALMDYIAQLKKQGAIDVVTVSEWYRGLDNARGDAVTRQLV